MERQGKAAGAAIRQPWSRYWPWLMAALLWLLPLNTPHLFDPDEGRYAEIPREMVANADWITPRLDGIKYFEKPPLQYWMTAASFELFGAHPWTVRLWPALCGFLGLLVTLLLGRQLYGRRAAWIAVLVQGSALLYLAMARIATLDMSLCFTLQLTMAALALLARREQPAPDAGSTAALALLLAVGVALAVLTKGLIGIVIPAAVAVIFMLIYRDARLALRARPWWTLAALILLAGPWFVLVARRNPEFTHFFFIVQHFGRYLSRAGIDRYQPDWFFVPVLLAGLLPWTGLLPRALSAGTRAARAGERPTGMLLIWAAFVWLFFSLSQSKLIPYILPLVPAVALLMGREVARWEDARLAAHLTGVALAAALLTAGVLLVWRLPAAAPLVAQASNASVLALGAGLAALALGAALGARCSRRGRVLAGLTSVALGMGCLTQLALLGADRLPRTQALATAVQRLQAQPPSRQAGELYCVGLYPQPVPFYLGRLCTPVGYRGELDFGLRQEPERAIDSLGEFVSRWRNEPGASAIVTPADFRRLQALGAPMRVLYTAPSLMVVVQSQ